LYSNYAYLEFIQDMRPNFCSQTESTVLTELTSEAIDKQYGQLSQKLNSKLMSNIKKKIKETEN
jgi:hypothetical protein